MFHERLDLAIAYVDLLAGPGRVRGLMGPREVPRLWDRHVLNCAVLADLIPDGATVADIGSGAGLPGIVLAIRRPDLRVTLIEPLLRRTTFLEEAVADLGLDHVEVVRARAEELAGTRQFRVVTSRAVSALPTLLEWSLPLVEAEGEVLAMKGSSASVEVDEVAGVLEQSGIPRPQVLTCGAEYGVVPTTAVRVVPGGVRQLGLSRARAPRRKGRPRSHRSS